MFARLQTLIYGLAIVQLKKPRSRYKYIIFAAGHL